MIAWQHPVALVALAGAAAPILVHLLRRHRAPRVPFPATRFLSPSMTGAVRLRLPSDTALLALRIAIVGIAACALARPVILTPARTAAWNARIARAVVVDASESMTPWASGAAAIADAESRGAWRAVRVGTVDLADGLRRAAARLAAEPPARREIVVVSDFQAGAIAAGDVERLPGHIGVRFARAGSHPRVRHIAGPPLLAGDGRARQARMTVDVDRTSVSFAEIPPERDGLRIEGATDAGRDALVGAVAASGAPAPSRDEPVIVRFGGAEGRKDGGTEERRGGGALTERWMLETALGMRRDSELTTAADAGPAVEVGSAGKALVVDVNAAPQSFGAAAALRAALTARAGSPSRAHGEDEVRTIDDEQLRAWSREAPEIPPDSWRSIEQSDARWFWVGVLLLLGVETAARRGGKP